VVGYDDSTELRDCSDFAHAVGEQTEDSGVSSRVVLRVTAVVEVHGLACFCSQNSLKGCIPTDWKTTTSGSPINGP